MSKDLAAFQKAGGEAAGLHDTDFFGYEIQSKTFYRLGDRFKIRAYIELKPPEKPPFSWGKLARNVLAGLAVVAVVAVAAAFTVATLGAGAVVVGAVLAGAAIAGT
ncbi:hypothetical protein ABEW34_24370, partial [Paenibacillus algorifonticola]